MRSRVTVLSQFVCLFVTTQTVAPFVHRPKIMLPYTDFAKRFVQDQLLCMNSNVAMAMTTLVLTELAVGSLCYSN